MATGISEEAIRERAYRIWQREGCPHGRHQDHWLLAEHELEAESRGGGPTSAGAQPKPVRSRRAPKAATARDRPAAR